MSARDMLNGLLGTEELYVRMEIGDAIVEIINALDDGDVERAARLIDNMLVSEELGVETEVGDEMLIIRSRLSGQGA